MDVRRIGIFFDDGRKTSLRDTLRRDVGSNSLFLEGDNGGTTVGLSSEEAHLTREVLNELKKEPYLLVIRNLRGEFSTP